MKETGIIHWISPNIGATNSSGFTALPGAVRGGGGTFGGIGSLGYWWSFTESSTPNAWGRNLFNNNASMTRSNYGKPNGLSVRCVRD